MLDLMRPLLNFGIKPEQFASVILELHAKRHCQANLDYEHELVVKRAQLDFDPNSALELFSAFSDRSKYAGAVPSGQYFGMLYTQHHEVRAGPAPPSP